MRHLVIATLKDLLAEGPVAEYAFGKTFEEAASAPFVVIHTSGSTGLPKPITVRHGGLATMDAHRLMSPLDGYGPQLPPSKDIVHVFLGLPPFHVSQSITTRIHHALFAIQRACTNPKP